MNETKGGPWPAALLCALAAVAQLWISPAVVHGDSMRPSLQNGAVLLLNKRLSPALGDLVVFRLGEDNPYSGGQRSHIKRAIGLAGDVLQGRDGLLLRNGQPSDWPHFGDDFANWRGPKLQGGQIWVQGDNRTPGESLDSRHYGPISERDVIGVAVWMIWPRFGPP